MSVHRSHVTEEKILEAISLDGVVDFTFAVASLVYKWVPDIGCLADALIDDQTLADACVDYLRTKGRCYACLADVQKMARLENWPNWKKFPAD